MASALHLPVGRYVYLRVAISLSQAPAVAAIADATAELAVPTDSPPKHTAVC